MKRSARRITHTIRLKALFFFSPFEYLNAALFGVTNSGKGEKARHT
jgi:hypothetical protein